MSNSGGPLGRALGKALIKGSKSAYKKLVILSFILMLPMLGIAWNIIFINSAIEKSGQISSIIEVKRKGKMYCSAMFLYQAKEGKQREQKNYHKYLLADCPYKVGKAIDILYSPKLDFAMAGTKKTYWQNEKKGLFAIIFLFLLGLGGLIQFTLIYKKAKQKR